MTTLESLANPVQEALDAERIGLPMAARVVACLTPDPDLIERQVVEALALVSRWLGDNPLHMRRVGGLHAGELSLLIGFEGGQSALISCSVCHAPPFQLAAVVIGSQGTVSYEAADLMESWEPRSTTTAEIAAAALAQVDTNQIPAEPVGGAPAAPSRTEPLAPPYGVLLIAGDHTHQPSYAQAFAADPRCHLVAVADETDAPTERHPFNQQLADRCGIPYIQDLDSALEREDVHIVSVCAEPYRRGAIITRAALAKKHLYLDKPLAGSLGDTAEIIKAVQSSGVATHMFSQALSSAAQRSRQLVSSGRLGPLVSAHVDFCFAKGPGGTITSAQRRHETAAPVRFELPSAKRELTNVGVYGIVWLLLLLRTKVQTVAATTGNYFFSEHQEHDMEDFGQILLGMEDGSIASVTAGRTGWHSHPRNGLQRVLLTGTRGVTLIDADRPGAELWSNAEPWVAPPRDPADPMAMWAQPEESPYRAAPKQTHFGPAPMNWQTDVSYFLDCLEQGVPSEVSIDVAAAATEVLFAAYRSAATGKTVQLTTNGL